MGTILARNLVHAALYLVAFFFIIACQFVLLEAEFLAAIQVLVYIGAVAILLMFGIMLTRNIRGRHDDGRARLDDAGPGRRLGIFLVLGVGINNQVGLKDRAAWSATTTRPSIVTPEGEEPTPRAVAINNMGLAVGYEMMTRFVVPFEVAGLLLTAALVGAIALAHREGDEEPAAQLGAPCDASPRGDGAATEQRSSGSGRIAVRNTLLTLELKRVARDEP